MGVVLPVVNHNCASAGAGSAAGKSGSSKPKPVMRLDEDHPIPDNLLDRASGLLRLPPGDLPKSVTKYPKHQRQGALERLLDKLEADRRNKPSKTPASGNRTPYPGGGAAAKLTLGTGRRSAKTEPRVKQELLASPFSMGAKGSGKAAVHSEGAHHLAHRLACWSVVHSVATPRNMSVTCASHSARLQHHISSVPPCWTEQHGL